MKRQEIISQLKQLKNDVDRPQAQLLIIKLAETDKKMSTTWQKNIFNIHYYIL